MMSGEFVENQVKEHLQKAIPRFLQPLWHAVAPFLVSPTPGRALVECVPAKTYCQKEQLNSQVMTWRTAESETVFGFLNKSCTLYPFTLIDAYSEQKSVLLCFKVSSHSEIVWDSDFQLSLNNVALFDLLRPSYIQYRDQTCERKLHHKLSAFDESDPLCPPLVRYAVAPQTLMTLSIKPDESIVLKPELEFTLCFSFLDEVIKTSIADWHVNSLLVINQYTKPAMPIKQPMLQDTHEVKIEHGAKEEVVGIQSVNAKLSNSIELVELLESVYPRNKNTLMYATYYEQYRLYLQLIGHRQCQIQWLSLMLNLCQPKESKNLAKNSIGQWQEHPVGWATTLQIPFSSFLPQVDPPLALADCTSLVTPLLLLKDENLFYQYLQWFTIKAPSLSLKISNIKMIGAKEKTSIKDGAFESCTVLQVSMPLSDFDSQGDGEVFCFALESQLELIMPLSSKLCLEVTWQ